MHVATLRLVLCLMVCCDLWLVSSQKLDSIDQSELVRKARQIRQHRQVRQTRQLRQEQDKETKCKFKLALLDFPPYIMNQSINRGFMHETLTWLVDMACFGRVATHSIACKMEPVFVQNQDEMVKLIKNRLVDFGFPIFYIHTCQIHSNRYDSSTVVDESTHRKSNRALTYRKWRLVNNFWKWIV